MSQPQKYTDSDIIRVIELFAAEGEEMNPLCIRMRLGGGNVTRIKTILERHSASGLIRKPLDTLPEALQSDIRQITNQLCEQILSAVNKSWNLASKEAAAVVQAENVRLQSLIEKLELELTAATELLIDVESARDQKERSLQELDGARKDITREGDSLKAALQNAENDLRATQKTIDAYERRQQQDREEIRGQQKRIENFVTELAILKAKMAAPRPHISGA